jgi:hypothetical protein
MSGLQMKKEMQMLMTKEIEPKRKWLLLFIPICFAMGIVELFRAFDGIDRSWLYVFEWPFFGLFIYYMYWKLGQPQEVWDESDDPKREVD